MLCGSKFLHIKSEIGVHLLNTTTVPLYGNSTNVRIRIRNVETSKTVINTSIPLWKKNNFSEIFFLMTVYCKLGVRWESICITCSTIGSDYDSPNMTLKRSLRSPLYIQQSHYHLCIQTGMYPCWSGDVISLIPWGRNIMKKGGSNSVFIFLFFSEWIRWTDWFRLDKKSICAKEASNSISLGEDFSRTSRLVDQCREAIQVKNSNSPSGLPSLVHLMPGVG